MSPPCPSPVPPKRTHLSENRVFSPLLLLLLATVNSVERIAAASARFLSPRHEEERTDAGVNTGNRTNTKRGAKIKLQKTNNLHGMKVEVVERFSRRENRQLRQTREVRADRRDSDKKKDRGNSKRDKRKVETYNFSLALCDPRVLIQYGEDLAKDPIKASPLLVSLRLGWQKKDHCCCGVYKNQVGTISC